MSIRVRLNALIIAVTALGLATLVAAMLLNAGPRIRAESDSTMRLAREFVETAIESLEGTPDPEQRLKVLLDGLRDLRHVHIYRSDEPFPHPVPEEPLSSPAGEAPAWLARLGRAPQATEMPVVVNGHDFGTLIIAPRRADEAAEIWDSIVRFTLGGAALAIAALLLMSITIARLLRPIQDVGAALLELDSGRYALAVPEGGPPEIADICRKLNRLASTLQSTVSDNKRLAQRVIRVQDEERKELARELHDELGPYLFAARAAISTLKIEINRSGGGDRVKLLKSCDTLVEHMKTIQLMNRSVLKKLRPVGLEEYGLKAKLTSLLALLRESHPTVAMSLRVEDELPVGDETTNLTIYRVVQEGLTNALRHSEATQIDIAVATTPADEVPAGIDSKAREVVHVSVADNGRGLPEGAKRSYGISGMSERLWASGGQMCLASRPGGGVALDAWVPIAFRAANESSNGVQVAT